MQLPGPWVTSFAHAAWRSDKPVSMSLHVLSTRGQVCEKHHCPQVSYLSSFSSTALHSFGLVRFVLVLVWFV